MTNPVGNLTIAISAVVGLVTGYSIAHWRLSTIFNQKSDAEIEEMRQYYLEKYSDEDTEPEVEDENIASKADSPLPESIVHPEKRVQYDKLRGRYSSVDEVDEDVDPEDDDGPSKHEYKPGDDTHVFATSEEIGYDEYGYGEVETYLTYYYHEDLLVNFWGDRVERPEEFIGNLTLPKPPEGDDILEVNIINHSEECVVNVMVEVTPPPTNTYNRNEEYIKTRWLELQEEGQARRDNKKVGGED